MYVIAILTGFSMHKLVIAFSDLGVALAGIFCPRLPQGYTEAIWSSVIDTWLEAAMTATCRQTSPMHQPVPAILNPLGTLRVRKHHSLSSFRACCCKCKNLRLQNVLMGLLRIAFVTEKQIAE